VFDTILGLPVHILVIHGVVVLLPLMALATLGWAWWPRASENPLLGWGVVAANAGVAAMTLVAKESGEELQARLQLPGEPPVAADHQAIAQYLPWFALGLVAASLLVQLVRRGSVGMPSRVTGVLTAVVVLAVLVWTVRTGHSGSDAVWGEIVRNTGR
jgi:hypothetical protein